MEKCGYQIYPNNDAAVLVLQGPCMLVDIIPPFSLCLCMSSIWTENTAAAAAIVQIVQTVVTVASYYSGGCSSKVFSFNTFTSAYLLLMSS